VFVVAVLVALVVLLTLACGVAGAATAIITTAPASISEPAIPVRHAAFARSPLTMAVMISLPYPMSLPLCIQTRNQAANHRWGSPPNALRGLSPGRLCDDDLRIQLSG